MDTNDLAAPLRADRAGGDPAVGAWSSWARSACASRDGGRAGAGEPRSPSCSASSSASSSCSPRATRSSAPSFWRSSGLLTLGLLWRDRRVQAGAFLAGSALPWTVVWGYYAFGLVQGVPSRALPDLDAVRAGPGADVDRARAHGRRATRCRPSRRRPLHPASRARGASASSPRPSSPPRASARSRSLRSPHSRRSSSWSSPWG